MTESRGTLAPRETSTRPAARTVDAVKTYGEGDTAVHALDGVTVDVAAAEFIAVMGPSGSGKSTLLHCLAGLDSLTSGEVWLGDVELGSLSDRRLTLLRRERLGFVFQAYNLLPMLTAQENITLPLDLAGAEPDEAWLRHVVATVGLTEPAAPPALRALGRPAAAGRRRTCARQQAGRRVRRRADRQPRLTVWRASAHVPAPRGVRPHADRCDGHARPGRCVVRRQRVVPCRRSGRRHDDPPDGGPGARSHEVIGGLDNAAAHSQGPLGAQAAAGRHGTRSSARGCLPVGHARARRHDAAQL